MTLRLAKAGEERVAEPLALEDREWLEAINHLYDWQHRGATHFFCRVFELLLYADETQMLRVALAYPFHALAFERWKAAKTDRSFFEAHGFLIP